jgi:hypothetical protein
MNDSRSTRGFKSARHTSKVLIALASGAVWAILCGFSIATTDAQDGAPTLGAWQTIHARMGLEVLAQNGRCGRLTCSFPLPVEWPEQQIVAERRQATDNVHRIRVVTIDAGVRQAQFIVAPLQQGESARLVFDLEIKRAPIGVPENTAILQRPATVDRELRRFLGPSPFIETGHRDVKRVADALQLDDDHPAWEQVKAIHDFTESEIEYSGVKALKGARQALADGDGDCEERTSVFVALCRIKGIPARSIWIPQHAYAEFYLETANGEGSWFPSESVGGKFGEMGSSFVILQKGDSFLDPVKRKRQRYITETARGNARRGEVAPVLRPIHDFRIETNGEG